MYDNMTDLQLDFVFFLQINAVVFCGVVKEMVAMPSTGSRKFHGIKLVA